MKTPFLVLVSLLLVTSAQAEVYRWVDDQGRVHFGDRAPQQGQAQALGMAESEKQAPAQSDEAFLQAQKLRQQRITQVLADERQAKEKAKAEQQAKLEEHKKKCAKFAKQLSYFEPGTQFYEENDDGSRRYMSGKESDDYLDELRKQYDEHCADG